MYLLYYANSKKVIVWFFALQHNIYKYSIVLACLLTHTKNKNELVILVLPFQKKKIKKIMTQFTLKIALL